MIRIEDIERPTRIKRISIVNFTGIRANWGCQATSWELMKFLNSAFAGDEMPSVSFIPLVPRYDIDKELEETQGEKINCDILSVYSEGTSGYNGAKAISYLESLCAKRYGRLAEEVKNSDAVFFQAEGTMTGTDFLRGSRLVLLPFVARHAWHKPVYSLNQTIFVCNDKFSEVAAAAYNSFDFVAVRENISLSAARQIGISPAFHIPDTAFLTVPVPDHRLPTLTGERYFMVTGSAYFSPDIHESIFAAADLIKRRTKLVPVIAASTGPDRKLEQLAEKYWEASSYEVIPAAVGYSSVAFAMKRCRFLLSGRYHMTIMAACAGVPAIQVPGNSYKNEGLSAMLGGLSPVMNPSEPENILNAALEILDEESLVRSRLCSARESILRSLRDASSWLGNELSGRRSAYPSSFLIPPGLEIDASAYIEPYRKNSIEHAQTFEYPPAVGDALGPRPHGSNMLPNLVSSHLGGDDRALPAIRQVLQSYPEAIDQVDKDLRSILTNLSSIMPAPQAATPVVLSYDVPIIDRLMGSALSDMKQRTVEGLEKRYSYGTLPELSKQVDMLKQEFSGTAELCLYHAVLIVLIRRGLRLEENIRRFSTLWSQEGAFLCSNLDSRWLVSACDTIIDHDPDQSERALAMAASLFTNTVKLYETERWATGQKTHRQSYRKISDRVPLHDGLSAFVIGHGDMIRNLQRRAQSFSNTRGAAALILVELMARASSFDTVFERFAHPGDNEKPSWNVFRRSGRMHDLLRRLFG